MSYRVGDAAKVGDVYVKGPVELRCGSYLDVLADVEPDAVITDPPYGERTHAGQRHGRRGNNAADDSRMCSARGLSYGHWDEEDVARFVERWALVPGWVCAMTSDDLTPEYRTAFDGVGRTTFAPLSCVQPGMNVRLAGDGPSNWTVYLCVSRPRSLRAWGTLPGAYVVSPGRGVERAALPVAGAKPKALMRAIVRDYSRPGDLVCDPCSGGATTLIAAALEGRHAIGAELDPETFAKACARIERTALTAPLPGIEAPRRMEQGDLW